MSKCKFNIPWRGECGSPTVEDLNYCKKHRGKECRVCGQQATRGCPAATSLVCGVPLCDDHKHVDHK